MSASGASRMHEVTAENSAIVDQVLEYSRRRLLMETSPLDKPLPASELTRLAGHTISEAGIGAGRALAIFEHVLAPACISMDNPRYVSFIPSAPSKAAAAFDVVVSASSLFGGSWLEGAGAVHAENEVISWLAHEFGLPAQSGGVFVQGGTLGNLSALVAARDAARARGLQPARWHIVCSDEAHSSVASAARVMDVDVLPVATDGGVLRGDAVRAVLAANAESVFAIVATAGTTNFGIIDDIASIATTAQEFEVWLHVDGAYGLAAMLDPARKQLFDGVQHADSVIVDPHKWLFAPFDACALIYRDPDLGRHSHTQHAEYLDTLTERTEWSPSDFAAHLSRRPRGLPTWFSLATYGAGAYREAIAASMDLAARIAKEIQGREGFTLVRNPQLSIVVFERDGWTRSDYERWSGQLLDAQSAFVMPSSHAGRPNTRFAILNPRTRFEDLTEILDSML